MLSLRNGSCLSEVEMGPCPQAPAASHLPLTASLVILLGPALPLPLWALGLGTWGAGDSEE